jgi:flagellar assembly factor FliW
MSHQDIPAPTVHFSSNRFGDLEVNQDSVITFPSGLIGFPRFTKFVMLDYTPPFSWLHSIEEPSLAFVVLDGLALGVEYAIDVSQCDPGVEFDDVNNIAVLLIVTVRSAAEYTVNTKAPLFVNVANRKGTQAIYDDPKYSTRTPLWNKSDGDSPLATEKSPPTPPTPGSE